MGRRRPSYQLRLPPPLSSQHHRCAGHRECAWWPQRGTRTPGPRALLAWARPHLSRVTSHQGVEAWISGVRCANCPYGPLIPSVPPDPLPLTGSEPQRSSGTLTEAVCAVSRIPFSHSPAPTLHENSSPLCTGLSFPFHQPASRS